MPQDSTWLVCVLLVINLSPIKGLCPVLTPPDNGRVNYGRNPGDAAAYTCDTGYTISGTNFRECQSDFTWTLSEPTCQIVDCLTPTEPTGGTATYNSTTYLSELTYSCNTGHTVTAGASSATCTEAGNWDNSPPTCTIDDCGPLSDPVNGSLSAPVTTFGAVATYTCIQGYTVTSGSSTRTCRAGGSWDGTEPTCSIHDCGSLTQPVGGNVSVTTTTYGSTATFSCNTGYDLNGTATVTCQADGTWETLPSCVIKDCGSLSGPSNGDVNFTTTTYNSVATFSCNTGYDQTGATSATCLDTGSWSASPPTCTIVDCGKLEAPDFGFVNHDPGTVYQFVAAYTCKNGHELIGRNIRRCQADGNWSSSAPVCQLYDCGNLTSPSNGNVNYTETTYGSAADYTCNDGYSIGGSARTTCGEGTWSGTVPSCTDIDECTAATDNCHANAACTNTVGSFTCACNTGYTGNGVSCTDIDECTAGTDNCDANAACTNTVGSFTCACNTGYTGNGVTCTDVDECTARTDNCDVNAACSNSAGSFTCACNAGYTGNGVTCTDIDECTASSDNCDVNASCTNTVGSFTCACNSGYTGNGISCTDIDECTAGTDNCDGNAACTNTVGSFTCTCNTGYTGSGVTCTDEDECTARTHNCDANAACANTVGSFTCACNTGLNGNGITCTDIDECAAGTDNCGGNAACTNTVGTFTCMCNPGYSGNGISCSDVDECTAGTDNCDTNAACTNTVGSFTCACNTGYTGNGVTCTDIDECTAGTDNCDANAACTNTGGSFTCSCNPGFTGNGVACTDVDECTAATDNCDTAAACTNTVGSFTCACDAGYTGDGVTCTDINECSEVTDNCDADGACTNTVGSFTCACNAGYTGNGVTCSDINECTSGTDNCDGNAACTNTVGSFTCACNAGYTGNGVTCTDVDECTADMDNCDVNAACTNTVGSFTCACNTGYTGNGVTCSDIDECTSGTDNCDANAACTNTGGSFTCSCNTGYRGDGVTCEDCGSLTNVTDGTVAITGTTYLETATYTCRTGYYISSGDGVRTCQGDGRWNGSEPVCTIHDCQSLTNPAGGTVNFTATTYQATATYSCFTGYQETGGDNTRTCQDDGAWSGNPLVCTIYTCPVLTDPADGNVNTTGSNYGDTATYSCNTGYDLNGEDVLTCGNGNWDNAVPACNKKDCGALSTVINNGEATQAGTKYGDTTAYTCNEGYMISVGTVSVNVSCQANGTWDNSAPTCIVTDCGSLEPPDNGQVNTQPGTVYQKLASYTCNLGYNLIGSNVRECQADGLWDSTAPTCQIIDCNSLSNPNNGVVDTSSGTTFFKVATYMCNTGYEIRAGSPSRTCHLDGNWNGMEPTCSKKNCGSLSTIISDGIVTQSGTLYEDTSLYTCNTGYYISTGVVSVTVTCLETGSWNGSVPLCKPVDCGGLPTPDGGQIDYANTNYGTRASYTCDTGHDLNGTNVRTCGADGNWDNTEPVCQIRDCGALTDPANGNVEASVTTYKGTAEYKCEIGYNITSGSSSRSCGADGSWDGVEPVCTEYNCGSLSKGPFDSVSFTTTTYGSIAVYDCNIGYYKTAGDLTRTCLEGTWNGTAPTCTIRDCGGLGNPSGGRVTVTSTTYNEEAVYECVIGYYSSGGNTQRTCQANGTWNGTELQCTIYDCLDPQSPVFGTVNYTTTTYGSVAIYSCDVGYYTTDDLNSTCGSGKWNVSAPNCTIQDCGILSRAVVAGSVVISGTTFNETAVYTCDTGFLINGTGSKTKTLTCGQDGSWDSDAPVCTAVDCGGVADPANGGVDTSSGTGYLDVAAYTCIKGYELIGNNVRTCGADGNWSDSAPVCIIYDCGSLLSPGNGSVTVTVTTFTSTAAYTCYMGHYISAGSQERTCVHGGSWNGTQPTCTIYSCGPLSDPGNGVVSVTGETYGETATYTCNTGYYRSDGESVRTCGNGSWSGKEPTCSIRDCGTLSDPPNGQVTLVNGTTYLQVANYTCETGYRTNGGNTLRTCGADGNWNGSELICVIYDCGNVSDIGNGGVILSGTTYGETATYSCDRGYYISSGDAVRKCMRGFWSGSEPACTIHDCGSPGAVTNGRVDAFGTQYLDSANYTCNSGYVINGTETQFFSRVCQDDGIWSGELPTCFYVDCGWLRNPASGMVDISRGTGLYHTAAYTCNIGYKLIGVNVRTCQPDGSWNDQEPSCKIKDCGQLMNPERGSVTVTGTTFGETASYTCQTGYYISSGNATRTCRSSGVWDGTEPVCTRKIETTLEPVTTPTPQDEREMVCGHRNEDLVFGIAVSSMTRETDFKEMKNLVKNAVYRSDMDSGSMRVGVFVFSQQVDHVLHLDDYNTSSGLIQAIDSIPYSSTNSPSQISVGLSQLLVMFQDVNGDRQSKNNYAFLILDDNVDVTGGLKLASQARGDGIHVDIFAIGFVSTSALTGITFKPVGHIIAIHSFEILKLTITYVLWKDSSCNCGSQDAPVNGTVSLTGTYYLDVATFSCNEGFDLVGSQLRTCQYFGTWDGSPARCVQEGSGSTVSPTTPTPAIETTCGLRNVDVVFGIILSNMTSEADLHLVKNVIKSKLDSTDIDSGSTHIGLFVYGSGFEKQTVALDTYKTRPQLYTAVDGFKFVQSNGSSLLLEGLKVGLEMFSSGSNRENVPDLLYMFVDRSVDLSQAAVVVEQAKGGGIYLDYIAAGWDDVTELETLGHVMFEGSYEDLLIATPEFYRNNSCNCGTLGNPTNGMVMFDGTYFLDVATYSCHQGYKLVGSQLLVCQYGGSWSGFPPTCSPKGIFKSVDLVISLNLTVPPGVDLTNNVTYASYRDQVRLAILSYYESIMKKNVAIIINSISLGSLLVDYTVVIENTESSARDFAQSAVYLAQGRTLEIFNETLTVTNMSIGDKSVNLATVTLESLQCISFIEANGPCDIGYECQLVNNVPECLPDPSTDCGFPGIFVHGVVSTPNGTLFGTNATYSCDVGYTLEGNDTRTCEPAGLWIPKAPTCRLIDCANVTVPENGMLDLTGGTTYGQTAKFSCLPGYDLVGQERLVCTENSVWSGMVPNCQVIDDFCGSLLDPQHGYVNISDLSRINSQAIYMCNLGYRLSGPDTRICSESMTWIPEEEAACTIQDCGILRNPGNGNVNLSSGTTYGQTVIFSCSVGYQIFGAEQVTCMADGNWSSVPPICQITNCGGLANPDNGVVSATQTTFGQVAVYSCNLGYTLTGTSSRICQPVGSWSSREPVCLPRDCGPLFSPVNGYVNISMGTTYGSVAAYSCSRGYKLTGSLTTQCEHTGIWNPPDAPTCNVIDCGMIDIPDFGRMTLTQGSRFGSVATYRCNTGYSISGPETRECLHTGQWSESQNQTTCLTVDCHSLPDLEEGTVTYRDSLTVFGSTATFSCNLGYYLNTTTTTTTCLESGNWDILVMPNCIIQDCGMPPEVLNGKKSHMKTTYGSFTNYTCDAGFDQTGSRMVMCTADGSWDTLPVCSKIDCGEIQVPANSSVRYTNGTYPGSQATFDCDTGFYLTGSNLSVCSVQGSWTTSPPFCVLQNCGTLSAPTDGSRTLSDGTVFNSTAQFTCNTGYKLTGPEFRTCSVSGFWEPKQTSRCSIQDCGTLQRPLNGNIDLASGTTYGQTVTFSCSVGYEIFGADKTTCMADGKWSNVAPVCQLTDCGGLSSPGNGTVMGSQTTYGQVAVYTCHEGYTLFGSSTRICQPNGSWSSSPPTCLVKDCGSLPRPAFGTVEYSDTFFRSVASYKCDVGYRLEGVSTRVCTAEGQWSDASPVCSIIDCGFLSSIQFGTFRRQGTTFGTTVTFSCNTGFQLDGNATVTCLDTSQWSDIPSCVIVDCGDLSRPENGMLTLPGGTTYGQMAVFSCQTGYLATGQTELLCESDGSWSGSPPVCQLADCGLLSDPVNGGVTLSGTKYGNYATYVCDAGHQISGSSSRLCQEDGRWSGSSPSCTVRDCGVLTAPAGGNVSIPSGTTYGKLANFVCNEGYDLIGLSTLVCRADGTWSSQAPSCKLKDKLPVTTSSASHQPHMEHMSVGITSELCPKSFCLVYRSPSSDITVFVTDLTHLADQTFPDVLRGDFNIEGLLSKKLTLWLNMSVPDGLSFSDTLTYSAYMEEVRTSLIQHYGSRMKDNVVEIIINSLQLGSLIVDYTVILKDNDESVKNFTQASLSLTQGSTLVVFNQALGVSRMTLDNSLVDIVALSVEERACRLYLDLAGPCQTGYLCTLVGDTAGCRPDPSTDCGIPAAPDNGAVDYSRGTLYGNTVTYTCDSGFTLTGHNTRTCQGDGSWAPAAPTCSVTKCSTLSDPVNGQVILGGTDHGQTAYYACNPNYSLIGAAVVTCKLDGNWNYPPPVCSITGCGDLPSPLYGRVTISGDGQTASYSCQPGYRLSGNSYRTCLASNVWSGSEAVCNAVECFNLPDPVNGRVELSGLSYGSTATYHCTKVGHQLSGTNTRVCGQDGQWSGNAPTCDIIECDALPPLSNGQMNVSGITYGQIASFSCNQGFVLQGAQTVTCMAFGWSSTPPVCQSIGDCGSLDNPVYGYVTFSLGTAFLSKATYSCYMGYQLTGSEERVCQVDNTWSGTPATCRLVDCGLPSIPDGGRVDYTGGTTYGRVATYTCNTGRDLIGPATVTCQNDATWSFTPSCKARDCGILPHPVNGLVDTVAGTTYGSTAIYTCNPGYYLQGVHARNCLATGYWDTLVPSCVARDCGPLATPTNGVVNVPSGTTYGQTATYSCKPGYSLTGSATRQCAEDGYWTGALPVCVAVVCGSLSNPVNGRVILNGSVVGSVARYACNPGYLLSPSSGSGRTCRADGTWTGAPPNCILIECGSLSDPVFGEVIVDQTTYGHTATFYCFQGYILSGSAERTCSADGYWTGTQPVCTVTDCGMLSNPENGKVKMPDGTRFGDVAVYKCNSGYSLKGYFKRTCQSNETWSGYAPTCESSKEFALAVGLGVGLAGFVILVLVITLIVVILYRRGRSRHLGSRISRKYAMAAPVPAPASIPVKINTGPSMAVPYYTGPVLMDDTSVVSDKHTTWRSRKTDYGDPTNPLVYNVNMPREEYFYQGN